MPIRAQQKAATRERLIDATGLVIAAKGLDGATVQEIARTAGVTTGALYASFASRADLIEAFLRERSTDLSETPLDVVAKDLGQRLEAALQASPLSARLLVELIAGGSRDEAVRERLASSVLANVSDLAARIEREGLATRLPARDAALLLQVLVAGTITLREVLREQLPPALLTEAVQVLL
jgi:AcrR family transcriptional regulator